VATRLRGGREAVVAQGIHLQRRRRRQTTSGWEILDLKIFVVIY